MRTLVGKFSNFTIGFFHLHINIKAQLDIEMTKVSIYILRSQTTRGIWLAQCAGIDPFTLVLDLEGSDGRERGEVLLFFLF